MTVLRADAPMTPDRQQAQQLARQELAQGKYRLTPTTPPPSSAPASPSPSPSPTPTQAAAHHATGNLTVLLVILLIVVLGIALLLVLRKIGKPRGGKAEKKDSDETKKDPKKPAAPVQVPLTGAALHRHNAEQAAGTGDWQEAIRERFRAVIALLDERALLPERRDRTADEAALDAGLLLPEHATALLDAARAFDEVEYGEYAGTAQGYGVIRSVDEAVSTRGVQAVGR
jgi:hypothetical protein